jgi:hypothetical protein
VAALAAAFCAWLLATRSWAHGGLLLALMAVGAIFWWLSRRSGRDGFDMQDPRGTIAAG